MSIKDADIGKVHNQVKSDWYLEVRLPSRYRSSFYLNICTQINPNGRIPAIVDDGFNVFETSAILLYLSQKYDVDHIFSYDPVKELQGFSEDTQWIFWTVNAFDPPLLQDAYFCIAQWYRRDAGSMFAFSRHPKLEADISSVQHFRKVAPERMYASFWYMSPISTDHKQTLCP
jgi:hypothetical protein